MTAEREILIGDRPVAGEPGWTLAWVDPRHGVALLRREHQHHLVVIEGGPTDWVVTLGGRRIAVTARSHRDRLLADTAALAVARRGPSHVLATLPGLVVRVLVEPGATVAAGDPLVTIEAMKMQNEIRAPRDGRVSEVAVAPGQAIATGALLVRLADLDP
ncbi:MAG TPA: acetyl-CoA carboxylase biotin carboxyl carrier protein subunit [Candidatus Limnocylindria bacterium]